MSLHQLPLQDQDTSDQIRSQPCPACYLCGAPGELLYEGLKDRIFSAPGIWDIKRCPNPECGLAWLDPMPLKEDIGKAYATYFTHSDRTVTTTGHTLARRLVRTVSARYLACKYGHKNRRASLFEELLAFPAYLVPFRRAGLDFSVMYLPVRPGGRLLEIGCGNGSMLKGMADLGWRVQGIDFDPAAVKNCRQKGLEVHSGTLEDVRYPDNHFDAIAMSHLIEHVHDPLGLLQECRRILKPGGRLSLVTPSLSSMGHNRYKSSWLHLDPPRHLHLFTPELLRTVLQKAGLDRVKISTTIRDANMVFVAGHLIKRTGRYQMGGLHSRSASTWGRVMQVIEFLLLKVGREIGEELAAIAEKGDCV